MSRPKRHSTATTTQTNNNADSVLNDQHHHLLSDLYPTPYTSPSLAPTRHHPPPSHLSSYSTTSSTTFTTTTTSSSSSSSYHTIAGAAAAHLIKQKQQLQQQQQQAIHDNAHTLPAKARGSSTTTAAAIFNIPAPPRKPGSSRIGQSILGQLLAAHSPGGRNNNGGGGGSELSSETHRPKEQQRRSVFPASWGLNFSSSSKSRTMQHGAPSLASKHSSSSTATSSTVTAPKIGVVGSVLPPGGPLLPSQQLMENPEPMDRLQPVLPSVWLENIFLGLSRADLNIPPHYATLPRVNWQDEQQQPPVFPGLGPRLKKEDKPSSSRSARLSSSSAVAAVAGTTSLHPSSSSTLHPRAHQTLHKKSSVCELALGDDARELFQQNRPKTLSSAVIQSQIVPMKESLRNNMRQRSLDSSTTFAPSSVTKPVSEPSPKHRESSGSVNTAHTSSSQEQVHAQTPTTVKTTRGRFTIESQSALPSPARTRTLSCTSSTALNYGESSSSSSSYSPSLAPSSILSPGVHQDRGMPRRRMDRTASFSMSPSSPILSHSFPSSRSLNSPSFPPSPRLSPLSANHINHNNNNNNNSDSSNTINTTSSPISIPSRTSSPASSPSGRSSHQRSQSSTSSMSSSRFSQVIIPPPASAASLQFASFSSIGSPSRSSAPSATNTAGESSSWVTTTGDSLVMEKRPNNSGGSNNIRNLSIQIVEADQTSRNSSRASRRTLEYEGEPTSVHPLDEYLAAVSSASTTPATTGGAVTREDGLIRTHQTMNRVHPSLDQDFVDSPGGSEGSSSLGSRVGSINGGGSSTFLVPPDRRASDNAHQKQYDGGLSYFDRTSPGSFRPRSLSATNLDSVGTNNGSTPSLHQQLSWADRTAMQREGSSPSRSFETGTPPISGSSSLSPHLHPSNGGGELSDVVMVKSAKGRMFTVERQTTLPPASPTRSSRFIVVSSTEDMCLSSPSPLTPHHALH